MLGEPGRCQLSSSRAPVVAFRLVQTHNPNGPLPLRRQVVTWDDLTGSMVPFGHNRTYAREELDREGAGEGWRGGVILPGRFL